MSHIVNRLRKNRELKVTVGKFTFICMRPTAEEMVEFYQKSTSNSEITRRSVIGWDGVTEDDIVGGGVQTPLPFDAGVWAEWCADRSDFWPVITNRLLDAYKQHAAQIKDAGKN
jgi:hypothetical protein